MGFFKSMHDKVAPVVAKVVHGLGGGHHQVQQDANYVSNVTDADVAAFKALTSPRAQYLWTIKPRVGKNGRQVLGSQDMVLAPTLYGFKDKAAVQAWFATVELAKV